MGESMERLLEWPSEQGFSSTRKEIIAWWEARRFRFNLYVGIVGALTWFLVLIAGSAAVKAGVDFEEPIAMLIGPFITVFSQMFVTRSAGSWTPFPIAEMPRTRLYRAGIIFSAVFTALPGVCAVVAWLLTVITGHKLD